MSSQPTPPESGSATPTKSAGTPQSFVIRSHPDSYPKHATSAKKEAKRLEKEAKLAAKSAKVLASPASGEKKAKAENEKKEEETPYVNTTPKGQKKGIDILAVPLSSQ